MSTLAPSTKLPITDGHCSCCEHRRLQYKMERCLFNKDLRGSQESRVSYQIAQLQPARLWPSLLPQPPSHTPLMAHYCTNLRMNSLPPSRGAGKKGPRIATRMKANAVLGALSFNSFDVHGNRLSVVTRGWSTEHWHDLRARLWHTLLATFWGFPLLHRSLVQKHSFPLPFKTLFLGKALVALI